MSSYILDDDVVAIAVMGATGTGKSTFINLASGSDLVVGDGLRSCTIGVETSPIFTLNGRRVILIDTPGFDDTTRSDTDILKLIAIYMSTTYQNGQKLRGVIYMHRISDFRIGGIARRNFSMFRKLCGDETLDSVALVTNMWGEVSAEKGMARERELASDEILFKPVIDGGARLMRHDSNTRQSAQRIIQFFLDKPRQTLRIQRELVDEHKDITETAAGIELDRELAAAQKRHKEELREIQKEMEEAILQKDEQTKRELEQVRSQLEMEMRRVQNDRERLSSEYADEKRKTDEAMQEAMRKLAAEERVRQQSQVELRALQAEYERSSQASVAERQMMLRRIQELQQRPGGGFLDKFLNVVGKVCAALITVHAGLPSLR